MIHRRVKTVSLKSLKARHDVHRGVGVDADLRGAGRVLFIEIQFGSNSLMDSCLSNLETLELSNLSSMRVSKRSIPLVDSILIVCDSI